jgi:hypothetical protein
LLNDCGLAATVFYRAGWSGGTALVFWRTSFPSTTVAIPFFSTTVTPSIVGQVIANYCSVVSSKTGERNHMNFIVVVCILFRVNM